MKISQFYQLFICLIVVCFSSIIEVKADHLMGSDISWKCKGKDSFEITVTVYRDCNGISMPSQAFNLRACNGTSTTSYSPSMSAGKDITPVCKKSCSRCGKKPNTNYGDPKCKFPYGIEVYYQKKLVVIKGNSTCCDYTVEWEQCCRSGTLTAGGNWQNFHVSATFNRCLKPCDNSPTFNNPPVAIICTNQCYTFNMGVSDVDVDANGNPDSLVFYVAKPYQARNSAVTYVGSYKYDKPFKFDNFPDTKLDWNPPTCKGFKIDSVTGDINFKATKVEQTVMSIAVESWTKDASGKPVKKSITRRDIQLIFMDCKNNKLPSLSGVNGTQKSDFELCVGTKKCFTINSYDPDSMDTVSVSWNNGIPGATFEVEKNKKHPVSTFCWEPGADKVRNYPYIFVANAIDDACPVNGRTARAFRVYVRPNPEVDVLTTPKGCGGMDFQAFPKKGSSVSRYSWSGEDGLGGYTAKTFHHYRKSGTYRWTINTINSFGCQNTDSGKIVIAPYVLIELPPDTTICQGDTVDYTITSITSQGKGPYFYDWNTATTTTSEKVKVWKDSTFFLHVFDSGQQCHNWDTMNFKFQKLPKPSIGFDSRHCASEIVTVGDTFMNKKLLWNWYEASNSSISLGSKDTLAVKDSGMYVAVVIDSFGCKGRDTVEVKFNEVVDVDGNVIKVCKGRLTEIDAGKGDPTAKWEWYKFVSGGSLVSVGNTKKIKVKLNDDAAYYVKVTQNKFGVICSDSDTVNVIVVAPPVPRVTLVPDFCKNAPPQDLSVYALTPGGTWSIPTRLKAIHNNKLYVDSIFPGKYDLQYKMVNGSGCDSILTQKIEIVPIPVVSAGLDTILCGSIPIPFPLKALNYTPTGGTWTGAGIKGDTFYYSDASVGVGKKMLIYSYTDKGCENSDTVIATIVPDFYPNLSQIGDFCATDANTEVQATPMESDIFVHKYFITDKNTGANLDFALSKDGFGNTIFSPSTAIASVAKGTDIEAQMVVEISNKGNCAKYDTISFFIYAKPEPTFNMPRTEFCISEGAVQLVATETTGRRLFKSPAGKNYVVGNYFNTNVAGVGTHRVNYTYFDNSKGVSCPADTHILLTVYDVPKITVSVKSACENEPFELTADTTNAGSITWVPFDPTAVVVSPGSAKTLFYPGKNDLIVGKFRVMAKASKTPNTSSCLDDSVISVVTIPSKPKISFEADPLKGCEPLIVKFTDNTDFGNSLPMGYEWDFGDGTGSIERNPSHVYVFDRAQSKFTVTLKVRSAGNCMDTMIKPDLIQVYPVPVADFVATPRFTTISLPVVRFEDRTDYKDPRLQDSSFLVWSFGDGKTVAGRGDTTKALDHEYKDTGAYTVSLRVRNQYGCPDTIIKSGYIDIRPEILVFIPNVFTPNNLYNDKTLANEQFLPIVNDVGSFNLQIFSRWGEFMFESNDQTKGWDGTFKGKQCQDDAYVYVLKVTSLSGKQYKYTGSVTLTR